MRKGLHIIRALYPEMRQPPRAVSYPVAMIWRHGDGDGYVEFVHKPAWWDRSNWFEEDWTEKRSPADAVPTAPGSREPDRSI